MDRMILIKRTVTNVEISMNTDNENWTDFLRESEKEIQKHFKDEFPVLDLNLHCDFIASNIIEAIRFHNSRSENEGRIYGFLTALFYSDKISSDLDARLYNYIKTLIDDIAIQLLK